MSEMQMTRDDIRAALLGRAQEFRKQIYKIVDDIEVEIRAPKLEVRDLINAGSKDANGDFKQSRWNAFAAIYCTFKPGSNEAVFEAADLPVLLNTPAGGYVDKIAQIVTKILLEAMQADSKK